MKKNIYVGAAWLLGIAILLGLGILAFSSETSLESRAVRRNFTHKKVSPVLAPVLNVLVENQSAWTGYVPKSVKIEWDAKGAQALLPWSEKIISLDGRICPSLFAGYKPATLQGKTFVSLDTNHVECLYIVTASARYSNKQILTSEIRISPLLPPWVMKNHLVLDEDVLMHLRAKDMGIVLPPFVPVGGPGNGPHGGGAGGGGGGGGGGAGGGEGAGEEKIPGGFVPRPGGNPSHQDDILFPPPEKAPESPIPPPAPVVPLPQVPALNPPSLVPSSAAPQSGV